MPPWLLRSTGRLSLAAAACRRLLALVGSAVGVAAAIGLTRLRVNHLFGVSAPDPLTFGVVTTFLLIVALATCYIPAQRAMRVDPIIALRAD